jgi:hypothetical protein
MELIGQASRGNAAAVNTIQQNLANSILNGKSTTSAIWGTNTLDLSSITIGSAADESAMENLANSTMSDDEITNYLAALGYGATITKDADGKRTVSGVYNGAVSTIGDLASLRDEVEVFEKDTDEYKSVDEEIEKYHEENRALNQIQDTLTKISAAKEKAFGANYINAIDQERTALEKEITAQKKLITAVGDNIDEDARTTLTTKHGL